MYESADLWRFLLPGYALTVAVEIPVLLAGLSPVHPRRRRVLAGLWLTACTYPIVVLVLPPLLSPVGWPWYLLVAETFAPLAECLLFAAVWGVRDRRVARRDAAAIVAANLGSFAVGSVLLAALRAGSGP